MTVLAALVGLVLLAVVLAPFFVGSGGLLAEASSFASSSRLETLRESIVARYLIEEAAFAKGEISKRVWDSRQEFFTNRYIDATRRHDFLNASRQAKNEVRS